MDSEYGLAKVARRAWERAGRSSRNKLQSPGFDPAVAAVSEGEVPPLEPAVPGSEEGAQLSRDEPNRLVIETVVCSSRCLLVLTDLDFPG